jgi:hypothetical protein
MSKRALIIGIDKYQHVSPLKGCVSDAESMADVLRRHEDDALNFDCRLLVNPGPSAEITRRFLRKSWDDLFANFDGDILFYFSGHGSVTSVGGYVVTADGQPNDPGLAMNDLLTLANRSRARSVLLILDCCYSGSLGNPPNLQGVTGEAQSQLREGVTILAASRPAEVAMEVGGRGVFTELVIGALKGGAADVRGRVSAASVYAYVEAALGAWDQRPLYKSHASRLDPIRLCQPSVPDSLLRELPKLFSDSDARFQLNPTFEETNKAVAKPANVEMFKKFKKLQTAGLLKNLSGDDLYWTAERSGSVFLTPLGQFYWRLANDGRI